MGLGKGGGGMGPDIIFGRELWIELWIVLWIVLGIVVGMGENICGCC